MQKLFRIIIAVSVVLLISALVNNPAFCQSAGQSDKLSKLIPENVQKIVGQSCVNCHADPGNKVAQSHVNLSKWDKYSPKKQAAKAQAMCNMVTKDRMPPKSYRENHPNDIPGKDDIKILCDWAQSLQVTKK